MSDYTATKKVDVLDDVKRIGNYLAVQLCSIRKCYFELSKVASKHGITRQTIYNNSSANYNETRSSSCEYHKQVW